MEYFKSGLKSVLGAPEPGVQPSGAETVERLIERVQNSTLLDDRRDACRALKSLSRTYRVEVGAHGMDTLRQVLETDHADCEIVGYALDCLCCITAVEIFVEEGRPELSQSCQNIGEQFTEIFIKDHDNVGLILRFLEEFDFRVRWPAVKLLTQLLAHKPKDIQEIILESRMGVSKLMDLLGDSREVIRNDALLLLIQLSKGNANIQKIVAFENAFDRLFDVISEEGYAGVVVEDCLNLMFNLLKNNISNQNFFKEGSYIQRLSPMFRLPSENVEDVSLSRNKATVILCSLQVVRTLVSPSNPAQVTASCQKVLHVSGILESLCNILMASGVSVDILTETICAVAETIRGNLSNQEYLSKVLAPSTPPREAIVVLMMSMVNEKQPFLLRCAILYCFQCFLFKNEDGQRQLVQTLLPSTSEAVVTLTSGQLLCGGLFNHDPLSNWFSAVALSHSLIENPAQREQLLRVLLAASPPGSAPISLLHQTTLLLQKYLRVQSKIGLLILLSTWLSHCPLAVKQFISIPSSIPYLTSQAGSNERDENEELVQGLCAFLMGICVHFNDDSVPNLTKQDLRHLIIKRIGLETFSDKLGEISRHETYSSAVKHPQLRPSSPSDILLDYEFCRLFKALEGMITKSVTAANATSNLLNGTVDLTPTDNVLVTQYKDLIRDQDRRLYDLERANEALKHETMMANKQIEELNNTIAQLRDQNMVFKAQVNSGSGLFNNFNQDSSNLIDLERSKNECMRKDAIIQKLEEDLKKLQLESAASSFESVSTEVHDKAKEVEIAQLQTKINELEIKLNESQDISNQMEQLRKDQEDLLELLADQDLKINSFKERLKALGEKVDDDEPLEDGMNIHSEPVDFSLK